MKKLILSIGVLFVIIGAALFLVGLFSPVLDVRWAIDTAESYNSDNVTPHNVYPVYLGSIFENYRLIIHNGPFYPWEGSVKIKVYRDGILIQEIYMNIEPYKDNNVMLNIPSQGTCTFETTVLDYTFDPENHMGIMYYWVGIHRYYRLSLIVGIPFIVVGAILSLVGYWRARKTTGK